jgi:hypothetical protein
MIEFRDGLDLDDLDNGNGAAHRSAGKNLLLRRKFFAACQGRQYELFGQNPAFSGGCWMRSRGQPYVHQVLCVDHLPRLDAVYRRAASFFAGQKCKDFRQKKKPA